MVARFPVFHPARGFLLVYRGWWVDMFTLENFYRSDEWQKLLKVLKIERLNADGELICWRCGKPITKQYDAIGHHTVFLTEENVNDYKISLNGNLIQFVHHRCHNKIHNKLGYKRKEIYLIYGSPCSGKSTYLNNVAEPGDLIVDVDRIRQCVSGQDTHIIIPMLNSVVFGIRDYLMDCVRTRRGKWDRAYIIGGFPLVSERERVCRQTGAQEIYIESTKEQCLERLKSDPNNRELSEWTKYIEDWWRKYTPHT